MVRRVRVMRGQCRSLGVVQEMLGLCAVPSGTEANEQPLARKARDERAQGKELEKCWTETLQDGRLREKKWKNYKVQEGKGRGCSRRFQDTEGLWNTSPKENVGRQRCTF